MKDPNLSLPRYPVHQGLKGHPVLMVATKVCRQAREEVLGMAQMVVVE